MKDSWHQKLRLGSENIGDREEDAGCTCCVGLGTSRLLQVETEVGTGAQETGRAPEFGRVGVPTLEWYILPELVLNQVITATDVLSLSYHHSLELLWLTCYFDSGGFWQYRQLPKAEMFLGAEVVSWKQDFCAVIAFCSHHCGIHCGINQWFAPVSFVGRKHG